MGGYDRIVLENFGGPEVLQLQRVAALPEPGVGEVRLRVLAAGVGYTDTILRRGRYNAYTGGLPVTPGYDVVGVVDALGAEVTGFAVGDVVADMPIHGAYGQYLISPACDLVPVPAGVAPEAAVEMPLMWMTAWQMLTRVAPLPAGSWIFVVGAAGAVGRALVQLGAHLGLRVVGSGRDASLGLIAGLGAVPVDYSGADVGGAVREATGGAGVAAAFDAMGGASWDICWRALAPGGVLVGYGFQEFIDSGAPGAEAARAMRLFTQTLNEQGAADGTGRRTVFYSINTRRVSHPADYREDAVHLLGLMAAGAVVPLPAEVLALEQAGAAHRRVAEGGLKGRLVLRP